MEYKEANIVEYNKSFWSKTIEIVVLALVVLVPVVFYPYAIIIFLPAKEVVSEVLIILER